MAEKWESSGVTEHAKSYYRKFHWLHPKNFVKFKNLKERKIRKSLKLNELEVKAEFEHSIKVLHRIRGNIVNGNLCSVRLT